MAAYDDTATEALVLDDAGYTATQKQFPEENILLRYRMDQRSGDWVYPESTAKDLADFGGAGALALRMSGGTNGLTSWVEGAASVGEFHASVATNWTTSSYTLGLTGSVLNCSGFSSIYHRQREMFAAYAPASFSMWIKGDWDALFLRSTGANTPVVLFHHGAITLSTGKTTDTNSGRFSISIYNNNLVLSYVYTTDPAVAGVAYSIDIPLVNAGLHSGWNNIVAVFRPSRVILYVNGVEVGSLSHSPSRYFRVNTTAYGFSCGVGTSYSSTAAIVVFPSTGFVGALDEVVVWNKALTPAEVQGVYSSPNYEPYLYAGVSIDSVSTYGAQDYLELVEALAVGAYLYGGYNMAANTAFEVAPGVGYVHGAAASEIMYEWLSDKVSASEVTSALYKFFFTSAELVSLSSPVLDQQQFADLVAETINIYAALAFTDAPAANEVIQVADTLNAGGSIFNLAGAENVSISARLIGAWLCALLEGLTFTATAAGRGEYLLALAERIATTATPASQHEANMLATIVVSFAETVTAGKGAGVTDEVLLNADTLNRLVASLITLEGVDVLGVTTPEGVLRLYAADDTIINAEVASSAVLREALEAGVAFSLSFTLDGEAYTGWVMNTKNFAVTEYQNFPFNSFCKIGSAYLGANSEGLYVLEGADDAGTNIDATFSLGITDFGSDKLKELDSIYLGFKLNGDMLLKTISEDGVERVYTVTGDTTKLHTRRVHPLAKGLRAMYWQLEMSNVDGVDFELDTVEFMPVVLSRRVR